MSRDIRTIQPNVPPAVFQQQAATHFDRPRAEARIRVGAEAADKRRVDVQVIDRVGKEWGRRWLVRLWTTATAGGAPSGSATITFLAGTVIQTITAGNHYLVETDDDGLIQLDIEISGVSSRWVKACVVEQINATGELTWA